MSTISCFILALSDTSFTKGVDSDFSLDEGENEGDNTAVLLANARKSVNLPDNSSKRAAASKSSTENAKKRRGESRQISTVGIFRADNANVWFSQEGCEFPELR